MYAANALDKKIIPMFARFELEMQLTLSRRAFTLFDLFNINNISVAEIILKQLTPMIIIFYPI